MKKEKAKEPGKEPQKDFESALVELEEKVRALEEGSLPLDEALRVFEEGVGLSSFCTRKLQEAEQRVELLLKQPDGSVARAPMPSLDQAARGREQEPDDDMPF